MSAFSSIATAGDVYVDAKAPVIEPEAPNAIYGSVSVGYESTYLFRGVDFGDDAPWSGLDLNYDLSDTVSINAGAWYINPSEGSDNDELDLYASITKTFGDLSISFGGTWFYFPEASADVSELGTSLGYSLGFVDLGASYYYDFETEGHYYEAGVSKSIGLTDTIALNLATGAGFGSDYYDVDGFSHVYVTAGLTFALSETVAFDIYVGGNFVGDDLSAAGEDDDVHGGASLTVSF